MPKHKRIGIFTSGRDCSGLNAAIRAVVHCAERTYRWEVLGICQATVDLMANPPFLYNSDDKLTFVYRLINRGIVN
ncbi:hypothetical protein CK510_23065 [Brunnivagina elsteri CCALA 953]|uniref:Phosphofructokinase domain-containing protein n=1 Tax=Brunnivagina elsteri CCALA 953 TaxID=987040 RepID=A0A2A2TDF2_9CYAN|nr:hypothetical protein CK510_23065 [Calothrix elsteri CCALA 953]